MICNELLGTGLAQSECLQAQNIALRWPVQRCPEILDNPVQHGPKLGWHSGCAQDPTPVDGQLKSHGTADGVIYQAAAFW